MKFLEKVAFVLFSNLILVLSIFIILMLSGWLNPIAPTWFLTKIAESQVATNVTVGVCVVLILLAMKCIFFSSSTGSDDEENLDNGILLENADGKLFITKETIKNIALNVICGFEGAIDPKVELEMDKQNQVKMSVIITAKELSAINQLSKNIQVKVKEVEISVNPQDINNVVGYKRENILKIKDMYDVDIKTKQDNKIKEGKIKIDIIKRYTDFLDEE